MHRFYLPDIDFREEILLTGREAHHAVDVLRVRRGEEVMILSGAGTRLICSVQDSAKQQVRLQVLKKETIPAPPFKITLLQAIPKGSLMDSIIQKATELGCARIVPLVTERVISRFDAAEGSRKADKWRQTAIEAMKQSGSLWLPEIENPASPQEFISRREPIDLPLVASLQDHSRHPREWFQNYRRTHPSAPHSLCIWIGPEGDFTPAETCSILESGAQPITLGPRVLRTETAATYCLSIINYELS